MGSRLACGCRNCHGAITDAYRAHHHLRARLKIGEQGFVAVLVCDRNQASKRGVDGDMEHNRLIIDAVYTSWEAGDLRSMMNCFSETVAFAVHPPNSTSYIGQGRGKALLQRRLARFLSEVEVVDYETWSVTPRGGWIDCRVCYHYRHRKSNMEIDGTQRHRWRLVGGKVVHLGIIHDTRRFGAFLDLAARTLAVQ